MSCLLIHYLDLIMNQASRLPEGSAGHLNLPMGTREASNLVHQQEGSALQPPSHRETASAAPPIRCLLVLTVDIHGCRQPFVHVFNVLNSMFHSSTLISANRMIPMLLPSKSAGTRVASGGLPAGPSSYSLIWERHADYRKSTTRNELCSTACW